MILKNLDFDLPRQLIAQSPANPRDHARLLVYNRQNNKITDDIFYNLGSHLESSTTLVLNNTKVDKCRLLFGNIEIFVLEQLGPETVRAMVRPGKKFRLGQKFELGPMESVTLEIDDSGIRTLKFSLPLNSQKLDPYRMTPLPPYIAQDENLSDEYQTVYAKAAGSKAAPTAGLHFTPQLLAKLKKEFPVAELTLHVGLGTFAAVKPENIQSKKLHSEVYELDAGNARIINKANHITAVGTTTARTLESLARPFHPGGGKTDIFIMPGYVYKNINSLITNFHLPGTSLLMLVAALMGSEDELKRVYKHAIDQKYRFYSFGDAMLII